MKKINPLQLSKNKFFLLVTVLLFLQNQFSLAQNFTLTSNGDTHATAPTSSALDAGGQITLRSAMEASTQIAGTHIITIPASITTINLTLGQITVGNPAVGNNITINGPGKSVLTINQTTLNRIFFTGSGAITFNINDLTMSYTGPAGSVSSSGGCIQAGGIGANTTVTNVAFNNFNIAVGNGGAFSCSTANTNNVTLTNCDFNNNFCGGGGGAVNIVTNSTAVVTNCRFINNSTGNISGAGGSNSGGSGGAMSTSGTGNGGVYTVTGCTFVNNHQLTGAQGGALMNTNGILDVSFCVFVGNTANIVTNGNILAQAGGGSVQTINANNNWWGINTGPQTNDAVVLAAGGTITITKWMQLKTSIATNPVCTGNSSTVTASFLSNSANEVLTTGNVSALVGRPISFVNATLGSLSAAQATIQNSGTATVTFTVGGTAGTGSVNAVVDNIPNNDVAPAKVSFTINPGTAVTGNPTNVTVCAGSNASFTASFSGTPTPTIQWQVSTNGGATYNNIAGATSSPLTFPTIAGNSGNLYRAVGTNTCGSVNTTGALLTVNTAPTVTGNPSNTSVPAGSNASFTASFSGSPTPTLQWQVSTNGGATYNNIAGATSSPLTFVTTLGQSGNLYRCVGTNLCSSATTTGALLTVTNACATSSVISVSGVSSICAGSSANIKVTITGGASPFTIVYNDGINNFSVPNYTSGSNIAVTPPNTTTYTLVSVTDANTCVGSGNSGSATITVNPAITAGVTPSATISCASPTAVLTATGGGTYLWSTGATTTSITVSSVNIYTVTVTGAGGCTASASSSVTGNTTPPSAAVTPPSATITCASSSILLTAFGGGTYSWSTGATTTSILVSSANNYTVTVTGANGCTASASSSVTANTTPPSAAVTPPSATINCGSPSALLTASGGGTYLWSTGATTTSISVSSSNIYTVTVTGANGCTASASSSVTGNTTPPGAAVTPSTTTISCASPSALLTASGGGTYLWSTGATTTSISVSSVNTYTVTVTGANGCTASASSTVTGNTTPPSAAVTPPSATITCASSSILLTAFGGGTYLWSTGATTTSILVSSANNYTVTVTGANGCTASASSSVTGNTTPPSAAVTPPSATITCASPSALLTASGGGTYLWSTGATTTSISVSSANTYTVTVTGANGCTASASASVTGNTTPPSAAVTPPSATITCASPSALLTASGGGNYLWSTGATTTSISVSSANIYTVTVTGANGCTASASSSVTGNTTPTTPTITGNLSFCSGGSTTLDAGSGYSLYNWSTGATTQTISVNTAGTFTVTVTNVNSCTGSASATTTVISPVTPVITAGGPSAFCSGGSVTLTASAPEVQDLSFTTISTGTNGTDQWQTFVPTINGLTTSMQVFVNGTQSASGTLSIYSGTGTGGTLIYSQPYSGSYTSGFTAFSLPGLNLTAGNTYTFRLQGTSFGLVANNSGYGTYFSSSFGFPGWRLDFKTFVTSALGNLQWYESGNSIGSATSTSYVATASGSYTVQNTVSGCLSGQSNIIAVTVNPLPTPTITGSTSFCAGGSTTLNAGAGYSQYSWSTGATTQTISVNTTTTVTVTVTDVNGCSGSASATTTIDPSPVIGACPSNITQCDNHVATFSTPTSTGGGTVACSPASGSTFATGTTTVTCTATNSCSSSSCTFTVTINETPVIGACPANITQCNSVATWTDPTASGTPAATVVCAPASGSTFPAGTTTVTCTATNTCGSSSCTFTVTINNTSSAPASATSNAPFNNICFGSNVILTEVGGTLGGGASYKWYEGGCGTGVSVGTGASVTLTPVAGSHTYYVRAEGGTCGNSACASITITVSTAPPAGTIHITAAPADGCVGGTATVSVNSAATAAWYHFTGSNVLFNGNPSPYDSPSPSVTATFAALPAGGASGWSICVFPANACGNSNTICSWVRATVSSPTSITGSVTGCPSTSGNPYSTAVVGGAANYLWSSSSPNMIVNGSGSNVTVDFTPGFVSGTLCVHAQTSCGYNSANVCLTITKSPATPGTIGGPSYVCPGASSVFTVSSVPGASTYTWTTSVPGATISPAGTSASILFPATIPAGSTVCVVASSSCGNASASRCKGIASGKPNSPGSISGPASGQCGQTGVSYSVSPVALATGYNWTTTCGTIVGPSNLSGVSVDWQASFATCTLSVSATNSCGTGTARRLVVEGKPNTPTGITGNAAPCSNSVVQYCVSGSIGATSYVWSIPTGWSVLGPNNGSCLQVIVGSSAGNVSARAANNCGTGAAKSLAVTVPCRLGQVESTVPAIDAEVFPNPATEKATLKFNSTTTSGYHLIMTDVTGRNVMTKDGSATEGINTVELNLNSVARGIYTLSILNGDQSQQVRVVVE